MKFDSFFEQNYGQKIFIKFFQKHFCDKKERKYVLLIDFKFCISCISDISCIMSYYIYTKNIK